MIKNHKVQYARTHGVTRVAGASSLALAVSVAAIALSISVTADAAVGRTPGSFAVSATGAATYSIPIWTPPGIHGMQPSLALVYSSGSGNGYFGVGWNLAGLSRIARCPKTWAQDGTAREVRDDAADRFCLDGNQLRLESGTYGADSAHYRTEIETYARIISYGAAGSGPTYFTVEQKDGLTYEYGNTADSRIESVGQTNVRVWAVDKISDRAGNAILFNYTEDATNGSYQIASIQYTQNTNAGVSPHYQVTFTYEGLPAGEVDSSYLANSIIKRIKRLDRIDITHDGAQVRRYDLTYEPSLSSTGKSRLASIQECVGAALDCLSPTTFTYQNGTAGLNAEVNTGVSLPASVRPWSLDVNGDGRQDLVYPSSATSGSGTWMVAFANGSGSYSTPVNTGITNTNWSGAVPIDYNADGLADLLVPYSGGTWWVLLGTTSGLASPSNTSIPTTTTGTGANARAMDIDGDGLEDLVWADLVGYAGGDAIRYRLRVWGGTFSSTVTTLVGPLPANQMMSLVFGAVGQSLPQRVPDFNGDGRGDVYYEKTSRVWLDTYYLYSYSLQVVLSGGGTFAAGGLNAVSPAYFGDFNGDGKSDLLYYTSAANFRIRFSTGTSFTGEVTGPSIAGFSSQWSILDWDGDGYDDLLVNYYNASTWYVIRSTGEALSSPVSTGLTSATDVTVTDANGDGLLEIAYGAGGVLKYRTHAGSAPDLLQTATDGFGMGVTFNYAPISQNAYTKYATASFPEQDYQGPLYVVSSVTASTGIASPATYTQSLWYYGARMHAQGRGFEGFASKRTYDSRNGLYAYEYYKQAFPYTGTLAESRLYQSNNTTLISRTQNDWLDHTLGSGYQSRRFPYVSGSTVRRYEVGGGPTFDGKLVVTAVTSNTVDSATGTVSDTTTTTTESSEGNGLNPGATFTQRTYLQTLFTDTSSGHWCLGRPGITLSINSHSMAYGTTITREVDTTWDGAMCRPTHTVIEPNSSSYKVTTDLGYDSFGNANSQTVTGIGMSARNTSTNWGPRGQFPMTVTNALSQTTTNAWDFALGLQTSQTDPNGLVTSWVYDNLGRRTRENRPDGTATTWDYSDCAPSNCVNSNNKIVVVATERNSANGAIRDEWTYLDKLDRPLVTRTLTLSGAYSRVDREYDSLGRVARESAPCNWSSCTQYWTTYTYDVLNRATQVSRRVSAADPTLQTTQTYYEGLTTRVVDALGKQSSTVANAAGLIARSADHDSYAQNFSYDAFGSLRSVTDTQGSTLFTATYDYGLRAFQRTTSDTDLGARSYTYNALGELTNSTDAKGQNFVYTYDVLSRPLTRTEPDLTTNWTWGTSSASHNIGRLEGVSADLYSESYTYDVKGRLASRSVSIPSDGTYVFGFTYSSSTGLPDTLTYPTSTSGYRLKLQYAYQYGLLQQVSDYNAPSTVFWHANATNVRGQVTQETLGNGLITNRVFDAVTGWVSNVQTGVGGGAAEQNESYLFDRVGNLTQRQNNNAGLTENFYYDNLHRLDHSTLGTTTNLSLTYDPNGNITSRSDIAGGATWTYGTSRKHAVTQAGSSAYTYAYDANGNAQSRNGYTISWTSYNHPSLINSGGESVSFAYDHNHERYRATYSGSAGVETTYFVGRLLEKVITAGATDYRHYIYAAGTKVAAYSRASTGTNTLRYIREDHQGSVAAIVNSDGTSYVHESFTAFGNRRSSCTWSGGVTSGNLQKINAVTRRGYTWHTALGAMGLNDMNGRIQDAVMGRFLSPDPYIDAGLGTQGYNRYSYVGNNPLTLVDPSGFAGAVTVLGTRTQSEDSQGGGFSGGAFGGGAAAGVGDGGSAGLAVVTVRGSRPTPVVISPPPIQLVQFGIDAGDVGDSPDVDQLCHASAGPVDDVVGGILDWLEEHGGATLTVQTPVTDFGLGFVWRMRLGRDGVTGTIGFGTIARPGGSLMLGAESQIFHGGSVTNPDNVSLIAEVGGAGAMNGFLGPGYALSGQVSTQNALRDVSVTVSGAAGTGVGLEGGPYAVLGFQRRLATLEEIRHGRGAPIPLPTCP